MADGERSNQDFHLLPLILSSTNESGTGSNEVNKENVRCHELDLLKAVSNRNTKLVYKLLTESRCYHKLDLNACVQHTTPLCTAAANGGLEICHMLLTSDHHNIDINQTNDSGETPLLLAIKNCHLKVAEILVSLGADVNKPEPMGTIATPLFNAVWRGRSDLVKLLLKHGCDTNRGSCRNSPLFMAARLGCVEITKTLLAANCDKDWQNRFGVTALYEAVLRGNSKVVKVLLDAKCNPNLADKYGKTPLHLIAQEYNMRTCTNNLDILNQLCLSGGDPCLGDQSGDTPADLAIHHNKPWVLGPLLELGSQLNCRVHKLGALSQALRHGYIEVATILLQAHPCHVIEPSAEVIFLFNTSPNFAQMLMLSALSTGILPKQTMNGLQRSPHLGFYFYQPLTLHNCCRNAIRNCLKLRILSAVKLLPLPDRLKKFLLYEEDLDERDSDPSREKDYIKHLRTLPYTHFSK